MFVDQSFTQNFVDSDFIKTLVKEFNKDYDSLLKICIVSFKF